MPPRRRARAVHPPAASSSGITDLPDGVLTSVLQHLSQTERLQHAALVCQRFRDLSCTPELVQQTAVSIQGGSGSDSSTLAKARALLGWLAKHGKHIVALEITLTPGEGCSAAVKEELAALVAACLAACGGADGQLEDLWVDEGTRLVTTAWLLAMPKLRVASIGSAEASLTLTDGLHSLSELESLTLHGQPLQLPAQLPRCLTLLELRDPGTPEMPPQIAQLSRLCSLSFTECTYSQGSMRALTQLAPTLTSLKLDACPKLPPTLSALTGLQRLLLFETPEGGATAADALDASLRQLQQLTALAFVDGSTTDIPPAISSLPRLARIVLDFHFEGSPPQLPTGQWLRSLQVLYTSSGILAKSVGALASAPQLESVCLTDTPEDCEGVTDNEWDAFFKWAATHKPLSRLTIDRGCDADEGEDVNAPFTRQLFDDIMWLHSARPEIEVYRHRSTEHPESFMSKF